MVFIDTTMCLSGVSRDNIAFAFLRFSLSQSLFWMMGKTEVRNSLDKRALTTRTATGVSASVLYGLALEAI